MVDDLGKDFRNAADDLAQGISLNPRKYGPSWTPATMT